MAAMDEFRAEREAIKNGTFKQKAAYFWDYYKWHTIIALLIIIFVTSYVYNLVTATDTILEGVFLNVSNLDNETTPTIFADEFIKEYDIDTKEYDVSLNTNLSYMAASEQPEDATNNAMQTNYTTIQVLMAQSGAEMLDFIVGTHGSMQELSYNGYFADLSEILSEEDYALFEPYFLYLDMGVVEKQEEAYDKMEDSSTIPIPLCTEPDTMEKPIPVMIDLSQCEKVTSTYGYDVGTLAFGIITNGPNQENSLKFLKMLTTDLTQ